MKDLELFPIDYKKDLVYRALESFVVLLSSMLLTLLTSKLLTLQSQGIIEIGNTQGILLIGILLGLLFWDMNRQIRISAWERTLDTSLLSSMQKLPEAQRSYRWFRVLPLLDSYRKLHLHEVIPTFWSLCSTSVLAAIVIFRVQDYWVIMLAFYILYLLTIVQATLRHVKFREEIENEISTSHALSSVFYERQRDWITQGRIAEYKERLDLIFHQFWIIFRKTLKNGIAPTLLIEVTWSLIFIFCCLWSYFSEHTSSAASSPFLSVVIFELIRSFSILNTNCFKIGESFQVKKYLKKIWINAPEMPREEIHGTFTTLQTRQLSYLSRGLNVSLESLDLDVQRNSILCLFTLNRDLSSILISLISKRLVPLSGEVLLTPETCEIMVLDHSIFGRYSQHMSPIEFVTTKMKEKFGVIFIIDCILDNQNDLSSQTVMQILESNQHGCLLITQNRSFLTSFEQVKILA